MCRNVLVILVVVLLTAVAASVIFAADYSANELGFIQGYNGSRAYDINNSGEVTCMATGAYCTPQYVMRVIEDLPGAQMSIAHDVTEDLTVIGNYMNERVYTCSFTWTRQIGTQNLFAPTQFESACDINNLGYMIGSRTSDNDYSLTSVLRSPQGDLKYLPALPGSTHSAANAVNDALLAVGTDSGRAVVWHNCETLEVISDIEGSCGADAVNNTGSVVWGAQGVYGYKLFKWDSVNGSSYLPILSPDYQTHAYAINDVGEIVGSSGSYAVMWTADGELINLGYKGSANDINNHHQIVGTYGDKPILIDANGTMHYLPDAGYGAEARAINDSGYIVGTAAFEGVGYRAVIWEPVPEPSSVIALLCGVSGMAGYGLRRRTK